MLALVLTAVFCVWLRRCM